MDEKDKIIAAFIIEMLKVAPDDYMKIKIILMAHSAGKPALAHFFQETFKLIEVHRPRLIEMKGGTADE
ncbi:hypothetical protein EUBC25_14830 [Claveliimonas bilis]|uniref:hypothetical protein n=1 Tax=Claveliimonas bilis TaxID=3028070 RepID=UPI001E64FE3F|nr:hypothetical protein [Claveliimonas bilis]BCZ27396.1 hypothetical protein EUBC25_14830 [Claveliimonas bilis]